MGKKTTGRRLQKMGKRKMNEKEIEFYINSECMFRVFLIYIVKKAENMEGKPVNIRKTFRNEQLFCGL